MRRERRLQADAMEIHFSASLYAQPGVNDGHRLLMKLADSIRKVTTRG